MTKLYGFDFFTNLKMNSLDLEKLKKISTFKSELSKSLYKESKIDFEKETTVAVFGNYREKIWNGSIGEREILSAYGIKLSKKNNWIKKNINKSSVIAFGLGEYQSGAKQNPNELINRNRLNIMLERNHLYPIWKPKIKTNINRDLLYSPSVINYGLDLNMQTKLDLYRYDDDNYQNLLTLKGGPELTLGNFKNNFLDYTKISIYPKATISYGESPFGFDQSVDNHGVEIMLNSN